MPYDPNSVPVAILAALTTEFSGKVFASMAPDSTVAPYAVYGRIASVPENTLANGESINNERYQLDVWAETFLECRTLASQARTAMIAIAYPIRVILIMEVDQYDSDAKLHRVIQDYSIWQPRSD